VPPVYYTSNMSFDHWRGADAARPVHLL
jgi:hypothetical protein